MELKLTQGGAIHWVADMTGDSEAQKEWPTVNSLKSLSRQPDVLFFLSGHRKANFTSRKIFYASAWPPFSLPSLFNFSLKIKKTFTSFVLFLSFLLFSLKISQQVEPPCCKLSCINSNLWTASDHIKEKKITGYKWHQLTFWCQEIWDQHRWTQLSYFSWLFENTAWLLQSLTVAAFFF